jgi:hypothetical protein
MEEAFALGDVSIGVRCDSALGDLGSAFLGRLRPTITAVPDVSITLRAATEILPDPALEPGLRRTFFFDDVAGFTGSGRLELWDGATRVVVRENQVSAQVAQASNPHVVEHVMLFAALAFALRTRRLFHAHSAAVVAPGVGGILIVGDSGTGKTTLALALRAAGSHLVTDDALFLCRTASGIRAVGWPRAAHVTERTLHAFPDLTTNGTVREQGVKYVVPLPSLACSMTAVETPRWLLFPEIADAERPPQRLGAADTMAALLPPSALLAVPGAALRDEHLALLGQLSSSARALRLPLGQRVLDAPGEVGGALLQQLEREQFD